MKTSQTIPGKSPELRLCIPIIIVLCTMALSSAFAANPPALISLWHGEGNALDAVGTNHGVLVNGVGFAPGVSGQGFRLDGTNFVRVPDSASLNLSDELTIQMWFKRDQNLPAGTTFTLLDKRTSSLANYGAVMSPDFGLQLYYNSGGGFVISSSPLPSGGVWHHFAGTYRQRPGGVELITYIDGSAVRTDTLSGTLAATVNNAPVSIGSAMNGNAAYFKGVIDEVAIYNYALSPSEVSSNFMAFELRATSLVAPLFRQNNPFFRFQLDRSVTSPYVIEVSTNLVNWNTAQLISITNSSGLFLVDTNVSAPFQFYRLRAH